VSNIDHRGSNRPTCFCRLDLSSATPSVFVRRRQIEAGARMIEHRDPHAKVLAALLIGIGPSELETSSSKFDR
jgi:hypothetical protein